MLELSSSSINGLLKAAYFNPNPINVSRAECNQQDSVLNVFVELSDTGYPGSTYTLAYHPDEDLLVGTYFQAVQQQTYSIKFLRIPEGKN